MQSVRSATKTTTTFENRYSAREERRQVLRKKEAKQYGSKEVQRSQTSKGQRSKGVSYFYFTFQLFLHTYNGLLVLNNITNRSFNQ